MHPRDLVYPAVIRAARGVFRGLDLRIRLEGDEHVPVSGPVIIASNHISFLDFLLVGLAARRSGRYVRFLARHDVWTNPLARPLMSAMRHVPVDRAAPAAAYLRARSLLREGEPLGVFPEAGVSTSYTVRALMPGAVALARETGAPLLPMVIWGPQRVLSTNQRLDLSRGRPVSLQVGAPLYVDGADDIGERTRLLGHRMQQMLDGLQARPEHQPAQGERAPWHPAHLGGQAPSELVARAEECVPRGSIRPTWLPGGRVAGVA